MKTLQEIRNAGDVPTYMKELGKLVVDVLPSTDGNPDSRCDVIIIVTDGRHAEYVATLPRKEVVALLHQTATQVRRDDK